MACVGGQRSARVVRLARCRGLILCVLCLVMCDKHHLSHIQIERMGKGGWALGRLASGRRQSWVWGSWQVANLGGSETALPGLCPWCGLRRRCVAGLGRSGVCGDDPCMNTKGTPPGSAVGARETDPRDPEAHPDTVPVSAAAVSPKRRPADLLSLAGTCNGLQSAEELQAQRRRGCKEIRAD